MVLAAPSVLLAEDEAVSREMLRTQLERQGADVHVATNGAEALELLRKQEFAAAFFDLEMPRVSGLGCLDFAREHRPELGVVIVSAVGEIADAVEAMKRGAEDYLTKPCEYEAIEAALHRAMRATRLAKENSDLREAIETPRIRVPFVAKSPVSIQLLERVERVADIDSTVLLTGPSGTGKTLLARSIHQQSRRARGPFVAVNCASLPRELIEAELFGHARGAFTGATHDRPGRAEMADGGTLFLDEIGELPLELQPKLLTFLQDREVQRLGSNETKRVDVRLVAATNRDLAVMSSEGVFREDLYYRLDVISLAVPSLSERREDILPLCEAILQKIAERRGTASCELSEEAQTAVQNAEWRGNVRQLENSLERATAFCSERTITPEDLRLTAESSSSPQVFPAFTGMTLEQVEIETIRQTLLATGGNRAESARRLGVSEKTIYNKIQKHACLAEVVE